MERSSSKSDHTSLNGQNSQCKNSSSNQELFESKESENSNGKYNSEQKRSLNEENKKNGEEQQNQGKKRTYIQDILNSNEKVNKTNVKTESPIKKQHQQQAHVQIILLVNPRSGSGEGQRFLEEQNEHTRLICLEDKIVACNMKIYDVTKPEEREKYTNLIEKILPTVNNRNQLILAILGGDGSLPLVIKQIRQREIINNNLTKITFCSLPFGTGNDTGATFGWGQVPGPYAESIDTLINSFIWAYKDQLTFWEVNVDGEIYNPFDERTENVFGLCCYFNIGIDGEIGNEVERRRVRSRCINLWLYFYWGSVKILDFCKHSNRQIKQIVQKVKYAPIGRRQKVLTDLSLVNHEPLNLCGMNMPQMMGGKVYYDFWNKNKENKLFDREKILKKHGIDFLGWDTETASSCDDTDDQIQRYDDDKMELVGAPDWLQFSTFNYHRYGQAKSPFQVEFREDLDHDKIIYMANDGEYFKLKKLKKITFRTDPKAPKLNMLRFNPDCMI